MSNSLLNFFRKFIVKNLALKLVALAVALVLWWSVGNDPTVEIPITIPLEFHDAPENLEMNSDYPLQAQITMRGPERLLRNLSPSQVHAIIDLKGVRAGERTFDLTPGQIHLPRSVEVTQVEPVQFRIRFDRRAVRTVAVRPRVIGTLASGYSIADITSDPATLSIAGPESRVDSIESALTDPVDASGVVGKATFVTHAYVADPLVRIENPGPVHVTVTTQKASKAAGQP